MLFKNAYGSKLYMFIDFFLIFFTLFIISKKQVCQNIEKQGSQPKQP
jgi:hypothetical protein